ncbi:hypothetical protein OsI_09285 [Oryza sativa Indica Group]|uniref:non-specific serine/threonine protein kinase n=1 Tax=Oryza sativa subsp. indica TaxID=39946 RepID=B8AEH2_ORYSI|nr:hypothetical protein OsI_09285 [Oryza sativa Indica Group]
MGNKIAKTTQASATEYYLHDLPSTYNLVLVEVVSRGRFLKSVRCKHDEGLLLVKVYFKRAGEPLDLKEHERRLERIRNAFEGLEGSHVWPFQVWLQTDKAAYLLRQYFYSNLHDRLSTRPFLSKIEKKWLAFQLIHAVEQSHSKGICHGDIKCENVLVTSWNWLYLADFASFKPTYIPDDDPSDFSFFFDTGGRRRCYLAPERFYEHGAETQVAADAPLQRSMDIFSLGCVLAELFLEGQPLFELSQLLAYRRGQYDPIHTLEKIQDTGIRDMVLHMIQLDPKERLSCKNYLQKYESVVFPVYFSKFLHKFFSDIVPLHSDARVEKTQEYFEKMHDIMISGSTLEKIQGSATVPVHNELSGKMGIGGQTVNSPKEYAKSVPVVKINSPAQHKHIVGDLNFLLKELEKDDRTSTKITQDRDRSVTPNVSHANGIQSLQQVCQAGRTESGLMGQNNCVSHLQKISKSNLLALVSSYDAQSDTYNFDIFQQTEYKVSCEGMVLLASLLCSCIRSVKKPELRRASLILLKICSTYIDDDSRLQLVIPYVIAMLSDPAAIVRCAALETLSDVLCLIQDFPISDAKIFPEYILPMLSLLPDDTEESVRVCYASNIYKLALTAYRFLLRSRSIEDARPLDESMKQTPNVRRALLQDIGYLCYFFGHRQTNDFLLPILPAFLNDRDEQLRAVYFGQIVVVCYFIGSRSVEEYLLPYLEQALSDEMEVVLVKVLDCLTMMCKSGYLRKRAIVGLFGKALPLLCHPVQWVKRSAVRFVAACRIPLYSMQGTALHANLGSDRHGSLSSSVPGIRTRENHFSNMHRDGSISDSMNSSSSIPGDIISNSDNSGSFTRPALSLETSWKPRGVLVAHLQEHRLSVNDIAVSTDNTFFVTASDDSSVKIWDTRKLEKDIAFRSRLTYSLGSSQALCTTMLHGTPQVIVGASDGTLHLFSVDCARGVGSVIERYSGIVDVKRKDLKEGAILSVVNCSTESFSPTILFSTEHCGIHKWDTRTNAESWSFRSSPEEGYVSALVVGQCGNWFISGSSRGVLTLWDNRFLLPVNSWKYLPATPIEKLCLFIPPPNSISSSGRPVVFVAAGCNEVTLWDAENGSRHQIFRTASTENEAVVPKAPSIHPNTRDETRPANYKYRIEELCDPPPRLPGIRSLLPLPGGDLLTGGTDLKIRYWDQARPEQSFCIAGPSVKGAGNDETYDIRSSSCVQVVQEICRQPTTASRLTHKTQLAMAAADSAGCHRDAILALASVNLSSHRLISGSRDGAVKVWK